MIQQELLQEPQHVPDTYEVHNGFRGEFENVLKWLTKKFPAKKDVNKQRKKTELF